MKTTTNSVHFKADQKLETFITNKVNKLVKKHDDIIGSDVMLKLENAEIPENKIAEIRINLKGNDLFASKQSKSFEEATDQAIDALKKQLEKKKGKFAN
jgi:putative sigma-54 modulation protein